MAPLASNRPEPSTSYVHERNSLKAGGTGRSRVGPSILQAARCRSECRLRSGRTSRELRQVRRVLGTGKGRDTPAGRTRHVVSIFERHGSFGELVHGSHPARGRRWVPDDVASSPHYHGVGRRRRALRTSRSNLPGIPRITTNCTAARLDLSLLAALLEAR